jgi:RNA-directed DNA polymerase
MRTTSSSPGARASNWNRRSYPSSRPFVQAFLQERGLELSAEKTIVTPLEEGFDFLGQNVRKYQGKLLIRPSQDSVKAHLAKVRGIIKANQQAPAGHLIAQLNPVIRGWARYHRHVVSKDTFSSVDDAIFRALWRWAKRRHPKKGARWVRQKYFRRSGDRHWVFSGEHDGQARRASATVVFCSQRAHPATR